MMALKSLFPVHQDERDKFCEGVTGVELVAVFEARKEIWIMDNCAWDQCGNRHLGFRRSHSR
jgi:hypothetical protein